MRNSWAETIVDFLSFSNHVGPCQRPGGPSTTIRDTSMALPDTPGAGRQSVEAPGTEFAGVKRPGFCTVLTFSRQTSSGRLLVSELKPLGPLHLVLTASVKTTADAATCSFRTGMAKEAFK